MIHYICRDGQQDTVAPFLVAAGAALRGVLSVTPYERIFSEGSLQAGHLIFTDLDLLSGPELEAAQAIAESIRAVLPGVRILNEPARVLQRYALITALWAEGLNPFRAVRLDDAIPQLKYPVFIRREDGALGPESGLLYLKKELVDAIAELPVRGLPLRGRIAVEYCAEKCEAGYFRKYGAFRIGAHILPQHILFSRQWMVKQNTSVTTPMLIAEETRYIEGNSHEDELMRIFELAKVEFGRIDYGFVDGRLVVYEINTNPAFPYGYHRNGREHLRKAAGQKLIDVLRELDSPLPASGNIQCQPSGGLRILQAAAGGPMRGFQLVGRSAWLDRAIAFYWKAIPEHVRRILPTDIKRSAMLVLDRMFARRAS